MFMAEDASTHCSSSKLRNTSVDPGYSMPFAVSVEQGTTNQPWARFSTQTFACLKSEAVYDYSLVNTGCFSHYMASSRLITAFCPRNGAHIHALSYIDLISGKP